MSSPRDGFERLLARHAGDLDAIVRQYVDDPADREDLRQEIAVAVWRALPAFRGESSERTYVARIAQNRAITFCLRLARRRALHVELAGDEPAPMPSSGEHDIAWLRSRLDRALDRLPPAQREALALASTGHTPAEIARQTGSTAGAVRVALHRARRTVRRWLGFDQGGAR
jgi:RNA polymerase sigma-70 factor, ECF subfamily